MNLPPDCPATRRYQSVILWARFTDVLARSPLALAVFCDLVHQLVLKFGLGGIVLQEGEDIVLALDGAEADIEDALRSLRTSRYVDMVISWRLRVAGTRYRRSALARPVLTASERTWLRLEIQGGFSDLGTLPTLLDWLALRQVRADSSIQSEALVRRAKPKRKARSAEIVPFRPRSG